MQKTRYRGIWLLAVDEKIPRGKPPEDLIILN